MDMNVPTVAALILLGTVLWSSRSRSPSEASQVQKAVSHHLAKKNTKQQTQGGSTQPTPASQIWVDKAVNTVLRNDAGCCGQRPSAADLAAYLKKTYATEAAMHPGVQLVAHSAFA